MCFCYYFLLHCLFIINLAASRKGVEVKFPVISGGSGLPTNYSQIEDRIRMLKWERLKVDEDMRREQCLLDKIKVT